MREALKFEFSDAFVRKLDEQDQLASYRDAFHIPAGKNRESQLYFTGNSLGLQPKSTADYIMQELEDWKRLGVDGHFRGKNPWYYYHHFFKAASRIVGCKEDELVIMNHLTVNLHLLFVSFYRPNAKRYKIIMEAGAFPSDMYMVESQVKFHGYAYDDAVIEIKPRDGEYTLRTSDILQQIEVHKDELALVFFSGVQYYTGQAFDILKITEAAHQAGALAGFDLAHAAGNIELKLHEWDVDFAAWCSYKYLNSSPGGVSGVYIHEKHGLDPETQRFAGWWGHKEDVRFQMKRGYIPEPGAAGWQLSNAPVLAMAAHRASLELFDSAGMENIIEKGKMLNAWLEFVIRHACDKNDKLGFTIITPEERGCQLSILTGKDGRAVFDYLSANDVSADWREPNVIRLDPVPMYNSFKDIYDLGILLLNY